MQRVLLYAIPVIYPLSRVLHSGMPGWLKDLYQLNPLVGIFELHHAVWSRTPPVWLAVWVGGGRQPAHAAGRLVGVPPARARRAEGAVSVAEPDHRGRGPGRPVRPQPPAQLKLRELFVQGGKRRPRVDEFWALQNVSFAINPGDAVGVIGQNGTGKSTLLKLIAGVLIPDEGTIRTYGRVAPLLELSAGFANDLTGRENVQIVAALHGLSRAEVKEQLRRDHRVRRDRGLHRHPGAALLDRHAGAARLRRDLPADAPDPAGRRGTGGRRQGVPEQVLRDHRADARPRAAHWCWCRTTSSTCAGSATGESILIPASMEVDGTLDEALTAYNGFVMA